MTQFRDNRTGQNFAATHASVHNHFNLERHLIGWEIFKTDRTTALAEWQQLVR